MRRLAGALTVPSVLVLALAGCGGSSRSSPSPAPGATRAPTTSGSTVTPSGAARSGAAPSGAAKSASTQAASTSSAPSGGVAAQAAQTTKVPRFAHVVVVIEENHASGEIIGSRSAPFMNSLARGGALLTRSYAVTHPSYPNYLALFSGSTQGRHDDSCPHYYRGNDLGAQLRAKKLSFAGYAQGLPRTGYQGCTSGAYARKHVPWVDFRNLPRSLNRPMTAFPRNLNALPRVSFVIPDLNHDMHDGTIPQADGYLKANLARYVTWARSHDSLLVLTWDEDDKSAGNHIPTILAGAHVKPGRYGTRVDHYRILRTIEASFGLAPLGNAAHRSPLTVVWR